MENEQKAAETPEKPAPATLPEPKPEQSTPIPIKQADLAPPPAAETVLTGKETEQSADLRRKLEAKAKEQDERDQQLRERETRLAEREAAQQRSAQARLAPEKRSWLQGATFFD